MFWLVSPHHKGALLGTVDCVADRSRGKVAVVVIAGECVLRDIIHYRTDSIYLREDGKRS